MKKGKKIEDYKSFLKLVKQNDNILIGASGGPDSTYLTYLIFSLKDKLDLRLSLCYFNHCLRKDAKDEEFIKRLACKFQLPFYMGNWENPKKSQKMARSARYDFFLKIAKEIKANKIALGHNLDDNVETILFHIIRGEGPYGIPEERIEDGITIIRPLLAIPRKSIEEYLLENNIPFIIDKTNEEPIYTRNKIRLKLIPILSELNPRFKNALLKLSIIWKRNISFLEEMSKEGIFHPAILADVLRKKGLSFSRIDQIIKLFDSQFLRKEKLSFSRIEGIIKPPKDAPDFYYNLPIAGVISVNNIKIEARIIRPPLSFKTPKHIALFDLSLLKPPLFIRNIKDGDRFTPYGSNYQKKVARFFIDNKVPRHIRKHIPILSDQGGILWIIGFRRSNRAILTKETKDVLAIQEEGIEHLINKENASLPLGQ